MSEQNNKKATAVFSDNETVLKISGHSKHDGTYEAKENDTCYGCFFHQCTYDFMLGGRKCISSHRKDKKSIIWIKKEAEMTKAPALQHRHFDLIVQWAKNPAQQVWVWVWDENQWEKIKAPNWHRDFYAIGDKPTEPPPMTKVKVKIKLDLDNFIIEVPLSARMPEVEKAILDKAVQFVTYTHEFLS